MIRTAAARMKHRGGPLTLAADTFAGRTSINPSSDGGTWTVTSGTWVAGSASGGAHTTSGAGAGQIVRELGTEAQDVTWQSKLGSSALALRSRLLLCYWEPASSGPTAIAISYSGAAGGISVSSMDWSGLTDFSGASGLGTGWLGGTSIIRAVFVPSSRLLAVRQNGSLLWSGTIGHPNLPRPVSDQEYGTKAGMMTRLDYSSSSEEFLDFVAVNS